MRERTSAVVEEQAPFRNINILKRAEIRSWVPTEPETKNDNAGEDPQHVTTEGDEGMKWIKVRKEGIKE
jgi:hypothetical protein